MALRKKPHPRDLYDQGQIARAAYFTATAFLGQGKWDIRECPTFDEAVAIARTMGRAMVYAVTPEGWSIHICNVRG